MVTVDHNKNIQRIVDRSLADVNIFDNGKTLGKLRSVQSGDPENNSPQEESMPYMYVTTPQDLQETSPEIGMSIPNNVKSVTIEYNLVVVADSDEDTAHSQDQLYNLIRDIRQMTEDDPLFSDPNDPGEDTIFTRSVVSDVSWSEQTRGQLSTIITITLLATIGELFTIEIPGITDPITLISKPIDNDIDTIEDIIDDTVIRKDTAVVKSIRRIFAEFETSLTIKSTLRSIKQSRESNSYTINSPSGAEVITAYLTDLSSSTGFSDMETTVIQLDVVNP